MRGPRGAKDLRLFKDSFEEEYYSGGIDEAQQEGKWKNEQVERGKPKREPNLDEFMKTFALVPEQPMASMPAFLRASSFWWMHSPRFLEQIVDNGGPQN